MMEQKVIREGGFWAACESHSMSHHKRKNMKNRNLPIQTPEGDMSKELVRKGQTYFTPNYKPREMILDHGKGSRLWDLDGNEYIDFGAGIAVCSLGHADADLLAALDAQSRKLWHTSNIFFTEPAILLAEALVEAVPFAKRAYFCNSGAEANEAAIKLIRKWATQQGRQPHQREIITFAGSFHGRTLATVTATAQPKYQQGYEPLPGGFVYCPRFNDMEALRACVSENTCAILVEPVQGEGGVVPAAPGFLQEIRALCDEQGILLAFDEIQCGMGRTGSLFAHMGERVEPDILTLAKALGGGLPIGAMLAGEKVAEVFDFGSHGSTFGGNPVMCAVALAALRKIHTPAIAENVETMASLLREGLAAINNELGLFAEIRGKGLMIGAQLVQDFCGKSGDFSEICRRFGVLVLVAGPDVLRLVPPLTITQEEAMEGLARMKAALAFGKENRA